MYLAKVMYKYRTVPKGPQKLQYLKSLGLSQSLNLCLLRTKLTILDTFSTQDSELCSIFCHSFSLSNNVDLYVNTVTPVCPPATFTVFTVVRSFQSTVTKYRLFSLSSLFLDMPAAGATSIGTGRLPGKALNISIGRILPFFHGLWYCLKKHRRPLHNERNIILRD